MLSPKTSNKYFMFQCVLIYSALWKNQMDLMCLINPRYILSIYVRSAKTLATTVVVYRSNTVLSDKRTTSKSCLQQ